MHPVQCGPTLQACKGRSGNQERATQDKGFRLICGSAEVVFLTVQINSFQPGGQDVPKHATSISSTNWVLRAQTHFLSHRQH